MFQTLSPCDDRLSLTMALLYRFCSETFGKQLQLVGTPLNQLLAPDFEWFDPEKHGMDHLKSMEVARRSTQLMGDGGAHLKDSGGPVHLLPSEAKTHVDHCGAHKGSLSMQESPVTADICAKLETSAKFLRAGDNTPSVQLHMRIICGIDEIPQDAPEHLREAYETAREHLAETAREPLMDGDFEGEVRLSEIDKGFSVGNSIRWEYHCETNARFWALRFVLPTAIFLQWGLGSHEYDWGKTKAHEVQEILRDPINIFYMAILRVDTLLMYDSCFQVYQMKGDIASRHVSGPESAWMGWRIGFQEQLRYVKVRAPTKGSDGDWMHRLGDSQLRYIAIPRDSPLQNRLLDLGCGHRLTSVQVASTLVNHFRCRLRGLDRYFGTEAFSNHSLIQAMIHEDIQYDSDDESTRKPLFTVPSERALNAASILVLRRQGTAGHWSKQGQCESTGERATRWGWRFAGQRIIVNRQTCAKIYQPSLVFFERGARTHLEHCIEMEPYVTQLIRFSEGGAYYKAIRRRSRFLPLVLNPTTRMPWPLRKFPELLDMLIGGLAGYELIGSGHLERCMSVFTSMVGSRKRNVKEPTISLEVRSPSYVEGREAMGMDGWARVFTQCAPLQQKLKSGFYCGSEAAAYVRKLEARQRKARKRDKVVDYEQKDRRGYYLFGAGMAATGKKRKRLGKDRQKAAAQELFADSGSSVSDDGGDGGDAAVGGDGGDGGDDGPDGATAGDWDPDLSQNDCEECSGLEEACRLAACVGCGVVHCEKCIEEFGEMTEPFYCNGCVSEDESICGNRDSAVDPQLPCSVCNMADNDAEMLICDGCGEGFHIQCVGLKAIPDTEEWYCSDCAAVIRAETWLRRKKLHLPA